MSETKFKFKNPTTVKLTRQEEIEIDDLLIEALPDYDFENSTGRSLFMALVETALLKIRRNSEPRPEDREAIQNLTGEIGRLKILIDQKDEAIAEANILCEAAKEGMDEAYAELSRKPEAVDLGENEFTLNIPPIIQKVIEIEIVTAKKKTGKDFNIVDILLNSFWESVKIGRVSPFRQWSSSELSNLAKQLQSEQK